MKVYPHLWLDSRAEQAMRFYTSVFEDVVAVFYQHAREFADDVRVRRGSSCYAIDAHSCRSATTGSTLAARRAGIRLAKSAVAPRSSTTAASVVGSVGLTP